MDIRNRRAILQSAGQALSSARGTPKQVVLIYALVLTALSLASTVVSYLLSGQIAGTGGLANLGLRSVLSTIQFILPIVQMLVLMCMGLGYQASMLNIVRNRPAAIRDLKTGFGLFLPQLRASILQSCIYLAAIVAAMYLSVWIFMLLPASDAFYDLMEPLMASMTVLDTSVAIDDATLAAAMSAMVPMYFILAAVCILLLAPLVYQYRMVPYCLLDSPRPGALAALRESRDMMRRNRFALFRLDLGFWWYYLLQVVVSVVCYGDILLPMVGVTFPWSDTVSYFLFYILSLVLQLAVFYFFMNRVNVTYATVYETLRPRPEESNGVPLGNIFDM